MVDATIIEAALATKIEDKARDPEMHRAKKGDEWLFGMKAHVGVDVDSGLLHSVHTTAANESDVVYVYGLLHGDESAVFADAGYTGVSKRPEITEAIP